MNFKYWLEYIDAGPAIDFKKLSIRGALKKITPDSRVSEIIPARIGYDTYRILGRYSEQSKFKDADDVLFKRGDKVDWVTVNISNQQLANLRELCDFIIKNSEDPIEKRVAFATIERLKDL